MLKKKIWANFQRIIELFTQKIVTKPSKIWIWDLGSGIQKKPIPDPGVKKAPDPGSGPATLKFSRHGPVHLSPVTWPQAIRYWYSLTPLMHIVAQLRPIDLHNFLGQIPESSQFLGASKLPLVE
jgi:hypothetical protein